MALPTIPLRCYHPRRNPEYCGLKLLPLSVCDSRLLLLFELLAAFETSQQQSDTNLQFPGRLQEYQVIGRHLPTEANPTPKLYRMRIFAPNEVVAKSRFWYFLMKLKKVKKANGEIVSLNKVRFMPLVVYGL